MSKSSELDKVSKVYLIGAMTDHLIDDHNVEKMTNKEIIEEVERHFISSHQWKVNKDGKIVALTAWLQGLGLPVDYTHCDIIQLAKDWGSIPHDATAKQEDMICDNYWSFLANKVNQLFRGYRVPK
tara:strand:+ start:984 stop:1361 length:378 start_codon:yes stop_codon:yes gene_type:complete